MDDVADRSIAVLKARLPYIDRRSLSQAWFSALELAHDAPPRAPRGREAPEKLHEGTETPPPRTQRTSRESGSSARTSPSRTALEDRAKSTCVDASLRREQRAKARSGAEPTFAQARSYPAFGTSLTLGVGGGRVQLILRREGSVLHVVALCAPVHEAAVRRALAGARAHLRTCGDTLRVDVQTREIRA